MPSRVPPWTVVVVAVAFALAALALAASAVVLVVAGTWGGLLVLAGAAVPASVADGLWRRRRGARLVACLLAAGLLLAGLRMTGRGDPAGPAYLTAGAVVVAALLLPRSARAWFAAPETPHR